MEKVFTGAEWDGKPIWRETTAREKLLHEIELNERRREQEKALMANTFPKLSESAEGLMSLSIKQ